MSTELTVPGSSSILTKNPVFRSHSHRSDRSGCGIFHPFTDRDYGLCLFQRSAPDQPFLPDFVPSTIKGTFGIAGNIVNTLYIIILTLLIATPIGVGSAIYLNEYAKPGKIVRLIEFTTKPFPVFLLSFSVCLVWYFSEPPWDLAIPS